MFSPSEDKDEALRTEDRRLTDQIIWDSFPKQPPAIAIVIGAVVSFIAVYIVLPLAAIAVAIHFIRRFW